jgi:glycosyltransferase involved in cell wall biosynthesis
MTLVEAGVAGTAIVSTDVGVASELLSGGVVCPPRDAECLAHHVLVALKEPQNYRMTDSFALINSREVYLQKYKESLLV